MQPISVKLRFTCFLYCAVALFQVWQKDSTLFVFSLQVLSYRAFSSFRCESELHEIYSLVCGCFTSVSWFPQVLNPYIRPCLYICNIYKPEIEGYMSMVVYGSL